jgi:FkbM family methyltransferase
MLTPWVLSSRRHPSRREGLFTSAIRTFAWVPPLRGRTRLFLLLYGWLGLGRRHIEVETLLRRPTPFRAHLDLHSWLQRIAFITGGYEPETVEFLLQLHRAMGSQGYLLDVGANVGLVSVPFALAVRERQDRGHREGLVTVGVEAVSANAAALRRNIELNGLESAVGVINIALGDAEKTVDIQIEGDLEDGEGTGTANILADDSTHQCVRVPIQLSTVDGLVPTGQLPPGCRVMKIDADGYDLKVLQGAKRFLTINRPVIFGEFSAHCLQWHGQSISDVVRFAIDLDYVVWRRYTDGWRFTTELDEHTFSQDLLLVPAESVRDLSWCLAS